MRILSFWASSSRALASKKPDKSSVGVLRSSDINKPGQKVGTDQTVSAQHGLVPQEKVSMKRARIWGATVFVDYTTHWVKVHLIKYREVVNVLPEE